uniref:Uncharacterized protein n=1 Tax=virus sp. ctx9V1 TaxID=2828001 RepID=A0A8S5RDS0_9VIRU|nr:MAG TPA: hypothetical protein [virus sp. ctx9V1]
MVLNADLMVIYKYRNQIYFNYSRNNECNHHFCIFLL